MPTATKTNSLAAALIAFQKQMPKVAKDKTADTGKYKYTYADLASVSDAALPILNGLGVAFTCQPRRCDDGSYELVGVLLHESGDGMEGALPIFGRDPQAIGSSVSYGRRYLLGLLTGIVTEDDDDARRASRPAEGTAERTRTQPQETPAQALSNARARAWGVYRDGTQNATREGFSQYYEQWCAQPFADATVEDFDRFAAHLSHLAEEGQSA